MQQKDWADRRKALDPSIYRPKLYTLDAVVETKINGVGSGSVTLDNTPFVLDSLTHGIVAADPSLQDGQYKLTLRDDQTNYTTQPAMAHQAFGGVYNGNNVIPLPLRVFFRGSSTLTVDIINLIDRSGAGQQFFDLQIVFHGFERWDSPRE